MPLRFTLVAFALFAGGCGHSSNAPADAAVNPPDMALRPDAAMTDSAVGDLASGSVDQSVPDSGTADEGVAAEDGFVIHPNGDAGIPDGGLLVRIVAANTTSGNAQSYDPGEGIRLFQGLHGDIGLVQEVNYKSNSPTDIRSFVDQSFGPGFYYVREDAASAQIPNAVISRYPIRAGGVWTDQQVANRGFTWADIDLPGEQDLWAVSVHLLTTNAADRNSEAQELVAQLASILPSNAYVVLGGDFNTAVRTEDCIATLSAALVTAAPYPVDSDNDDNTSENRSRPHDWVLATPSLDALKTAVQIGAASYPSGFVLDTRVQMPLSDVAPALAGDSSASGMQHMPVVREFLIRP